MMDASLFPYKYELHLHTCQSSACANSTGSAMADACKAAGYAGILVTDHHIGGNCVADRDLPWSSWVDEFCKGYEDAKRRGDEIGLDVFFGWESCFDAMDFIVMGPDKEWMKAHPELRTCSVEEQYRLVHEAGGIVIHAHPFRERWYIHRIRQYPHAVDAVEVINGGHYAPECRVFNDRAWEYARKSRLPMTAGSDIHHENNVSGTGICFDRRLKDVHELARAIASGQGYLLTDGTQFYEPK